MSVPKTFPIVTQYEPLIIDLLGLKELEARVVTAMLLHGGYSTMKTLQDELDFKQSVMSDICNQLIKKNLLRKNQELVPVPLILLLDVAQLLLIYNQKRQLQINAANMLKKIAVQDNYTIGFSDVVLVHWKFYSDVSEKHFVHEKNEYLYIGSGEEIPPAIKQKFQTISNITRYPREILDALVKMNIGDIEYFTIPLTVIRENDTPVLSSYAEMTILDISHYTDESNVNIIHAFEDLFAPFKLLAHILAYLYIYKSLKKKQLLSLLNKDLPHNEQTYNVVLASYEDLIYTFNYKEVFIQPKLALEGLVNYRLAHLEVLNNHISQLFTQLQKFSSLLPVEKIPIGKINYSIFLTKRLNSCLKFYNTVFIVFNKGYAVLKENIGVIKEIIESPSFSSQHNVVIFTNQSISRTDIMHATHNQLRPDQIQLHRLTGNMPVEYTNQDVICFGLMDTKKPVSESLKLYALMVLEGKTVYYNIRNDPLLRLEKIFQQDINIIINEKLISNVLKIVIDANKQLQDLSLTNEDIWTQLYQEEFNTQKSKSIRGIAAAVYDSYNYDLSIIFNEQIEEKNLRKTILTIIDKFLPKLPENKHECMAFLPLTEKDSIVFVYFIYMKEKMLLFAMFYDNTNRMDIYKLATYLNIEMTKISKEIQAQTLDNGLPEQVKTILRSTYSSKGFFKSAYDVLEPMEETSRAGNYFLVNPSEILNYKNSEKLLHALIVGRPIVVCGQDPDICRNIAILLEQLSPHRMLRFEIPTGEITEFQTDKIYYQNPSQIGRVPNTVTIINVEKRSVISTETDQYAKQLVNKLKNQSLQQMIIILKQEIAYLLYEVEKLIEIVRLTDQSKVQSLIDQQIMSFTQKNMFQIVTDLAMHFNPALSNLISEKVIYNFRSKVWNI